MDKNVVIYWSGGKDCTMSLYEMSTNQRYDEHHVVSLLTTLTKGYDRVSGHGVRRSLLEYQAACLGLELQKTYIPKNATMNEYESVMEEALLKHKGQGTHVAATGDIFVEKRRMDTFKKLGMRGCFPLMLNNAYNHMRRFVELGFKVVLRESFYFCDVLPNK